MLVVVRASAAHAPLFLLPREASPRLVARDTSPPLVAPPAFFIIVKISYRRPAPESPRSASHARSRSSAFPRHLPSGRLPRHSEGSRRGVEGGNLSLDYLLPFFLLAEVQI